MAKMNGVEVKALKSFVGREGYCYQGNIYIDGKLQGFWSNDANGGEDRYSFSTELLCERAKNFQKSLPDSYKFKRFSGDPDVLMSRVAELKNHEKYLKKMLKNYPFCLMLTDGYRSHYIGCKDTRHWEEDCKKEIEECKKDLFANYTSHLFTSVYELNIYADETHPAPDWMLT